MSDTTQKDAILFFGIIARGLKLWTDLPPLTQRNRHQT